jgi:hypothetical protein
VRLFVDANILVAELIRRRGRELVASPLLELAMAERAWDEARHASWLSWLIWSNRR